MKQTRKKSIRTGKSKKNKRSNKPVRHGTADRTAQAKPPSKPGKNPIAVSMSLPSRPDQSVILEREQRVFSIQIPSINGETTIGDLIVAFPRTRDVLMKHGLRFDVEEAGYLYMTLNVFSAIHGVTPNSLVQELHAASKEPTLRPAPQQLGPIAPTPTP